MIKAQVRILDETTGLIHEAEFEVERRELRDADEFAQRIAAPLAAMVFERWKQSIKEQDGKDRRVPRINA